MIVGPHARGLFTVTPFVPGEVLSERLSRGVLNVAEAVTVGMGILRGLCEAHAVGVLHRDLKPSNVILAEGALERAVLIRNSSRWCSRRWDGCRAATMARAPARG